MEKLHQLLSDDEIPSISTRAGRTRVNWQCLVSCGICTILLVTNRLCAPLDLLFRRSLESAGFWLLSLTAVPPYRTVFLRCAAVCAAVACHPRGGYASSCLAWCQTERATFPLSLQHYQRRKGLADCSLDCGTKV